MSKSGLIVTGIEEIDRRLRELEPKVQKKHVRKAIRAGLKILQREAKELVPVDTGTLKRQIKIRALRGRRRRGSIGIEVRAEGYAGQVEFGTSDTDAQPFMTPTFTGKGEEARTVIMDELLKGIMQEAGDR